MATGRTANRVLFFDRIFTVEVEATETEKFEICGLSSPKVQFRASNAVFAILRVLLKKLFCHSHKKPSVFKGAD